MRATVGHRTPGDFFTVRVIVVSIILAMIICLAFPERARADEDNPWVTTGSLKTGRMGHSAVLLSDGKVLVAGGSAGSTAVKTAELYDPVAGTWAYTTGQMNTGRMGFGAVRLADGQVLVVGGSTGSAAISSAEIYNPDTGTWSYTAGGLPINLAYPALILLPDGKVLVAGGTSNGSTGTANAYLYNPSTGLFTLTDSMNTGRFYHTATLLDNGKILVTGGLTNGANAVASVELYDPVTATWAEPGTLTALIHARHTHTATLLSDGKVLVAGGTPDMASALNSAELYDPDTSSWSEAGAMVTGRYFHTATRLFDGKVLITCGANNSGDIIAGAEIYDPAAGPGGTWSAISTPMAYPRVFHTATLFDTYNVMVTGGSSDGNDPRANSQYYDGRLLATITLSNTVQTYTGTPRPVTVTTDPAGLEGDVTRTYTGTGGTVYGPTTNPPIVVGTYSVEAVLSAIGYRGSATGTLTINKALNGITVDAPAPANATYLGQFTVAAHASSSLDVTYSSGDTNVCTNSGATFTMARGTGTCPVWMDQAGDSNYLPATRVVQTVTAQKAAATVQLSDLNQTFNTGQHPVSASTTPAGLAVTFSYTGIDGTTYGPTPTPPTPAGKYTVTATINNPNYQGIASGTLTVAKAAGIIHLTSLSQTYDSSPKPVTVTTEPAGLAVILTYTGISGTTYGPSAVPPSEIGTYNVTVTISDTNYQGNTNGTLVIRSTSSAVILLTGLTQTYDGSQKPVTVTTEPPGLAVVVDYEGISGTVYTRSNTPPVNAGSYRVYSLVQDENYGGDASATLVIQKANAAILISGLSQKFDGSPKTVTVTTNPPGLTVTVTFSGINGTVYDPSSTAPTQAGTYSITAAVVDANYQGTRTEIMLITDLSYLYVPSVLR